MDIIIRDDMIKESKLWKIPMIFFFFLTTLFPMILFLGNIKIMEFVLGEIFFLLIDCFFLYGYFYTCKYKVLVTSEKIILKTLFKSTEIHFKDIVSYNYRRYRKSDFYQFIVFSKEKKVLINIRYKDELEKMINKEE